jgi:hypothetical protein
MNEWRDIPGYSGRYQASRAGHVRTLIAGAPFVMRPMRHYKGHLFLHLYTASGERRKEFVHRLIASCFIANPGALPIVNHRNLIKHDNRVENLEWVTISGNTQHYYDNRSVEMKF